MSEFFMNGHTEKPEMCVHDPPDVAPTPAERLAELRFCQDTGRLSNWQRPVAETLLRAGLGEGYTAAEWAEVAWYGPLDAWVRAGSRVSDMFIDGPDRTIVVVEEGNRSDTGIRVCDEWLRWTQRQLLLRAGFVTPDDPDDWRNADGADRPRALRHRRPTTALCRHPSTVHPRRRDDCGTRASCSLENDR